MVKTLLTCGVIDTILDEVITFCREAPELLLIGGSILFIFIISLWTILERLGEKGWKSLIPIYRFAILFNLLHCRPWLAILLIVPFVNLPIYILLCLRLARSFCRSKAFAVALIVLPLVFLPALAFGKERKPRVSQEHAKVNDVIVPESPPDSKPRLYEKIINLPQKSSKDLPSSEVSVAKSQRKVNAPAAMPALKHSKQEQVRLRVKAQKEAEEEAKKIRAEAKRQEKIREFNKPHGKTFDITIKPAHKKPDVASD